VTRAQISSLMMSWLDDIQQGYFLPAQANVWINLAQRQVQQKLLLAGQQFYCKPVETTSIIGQSDYLWPSDFIVEHRIEIVLTGYGTPNEVVQSLKPITLNQKDALTTNLGQPLNYFIKKDRFTVLPTPQSAQVIRLFYSPMVADLQNDTDVPDVPEQFMEYVAILAAYDGFIKDDRAPENLMAKKVTYEKMLERMANNRTQDQSRKVVVSTDYDYGFGF
jgi:hypothetical protein